MYEFILLVAVVVLALLAVALFYVHRRQTSSIHNILHLVSSLTRGGHSRRADSTVPGVAGELARAVNVLADEMGGRSAQAQLDKDHLISLLAMLDHTNEIAIATDNQDCIRLVNPAAARVLDRSLDQLMGQKLDHILEQPELLTLYRQAFSSNKPVSAQIALSTATQPFTPGGRTIHCQVTAATIYNGSHYRGTLLLMRDITEVVRTLQVRTDFVANASHELRTPLSNIRAAVETLKDADIPMDEMSKRCVDIISNHALRLQMMVQDLLDLSRTEDPRAVVRTDRLDLQLVCDAVMGMYTTQAGEKHVQLLVDIGSGAGALPGDERLLTLTLKNLVDNALKFTPTGSVTIRSYIQAQAADTAGASASVVVEVADTGCGIPEEDQQRVFERFYTVNRSRGGADRGTGLGLAIVKHAVAAMGGQVELESELNRGTTVRCVFPYRNGHGSEAAAAVGP